MIWIVLAIIVVGFFVVRAINANGNRNALLEVEKIKNSESYKKQQVVNDFYLKKVIYQKQEAIRDQYTEDIKTLKNTNLTKAEKLKQIRKHQEESNKAQEKAWQEWEDYKLKAGMDINLDYEEIKSMAEPYVQEQKEASQERQQLFKTLNINTVL